MEHSPGLSPMTLCLVPKQSHNCGVLGGDSACRRSRCIGDVFLCVYRSMVVVQETKHSFAFISKANSLLSLLISS